MGCLQWFRSNIFVLWTYWYLPSAWFLMQQQEKGSQNITGVEAIWKEHCDAIKQAKAPLVKLDGSTGREAGTCKESKGPTSWLRPAKLTQPCLLNSWLKSSKPRVPQTRPKPRENRVPWTCSCSVQTFGQAMQSTCGTRLSNKQTASDPYTDPQSCSKK